MKSLISAMVVLCASVSFGQQAGYIPYTPGSTGNTQVVNVDQGGIPGYQNYVQPAPPPPVGNQLPVQTWTSGLHEEFRNIHEVRPIQPWETQQVYQNQQVYVPVSYTHLVRL